MLMKIVPIYGQIAKPGSSANSGPEVFNACHSVDVSSMCSKLWWRHDLVVSS